MVVFRWFRSAAAAAGRRAAFDRDEIGENPIGRVHRQNLFVIADFFFHFADRRIVRGEEIFELRTIAIERVFEIFQSRNVDDRQFR